MSETVTASSVSNSIEVVQTNFLGFNLDAPTGLFWSNGDPILMRDAWRLDSQQGC